MTTTKLMTREEFDVELDEYAHAQIAGHVDAIRRHGRAVCAAYSAALARIVELEQRLAEARRAHRETIKDAGYSGHDVCPVRNASGIPCMLSEGHTGNHFCGLRSW